MYLLRYVAESLGSNVSWKDNNTTVNSYTKGLDAIVFKIGSQKTYMPRN